MIEKYSREWWDERTIPEPNTGCHSKGRGRPFGLPVDGDMSDWHQQAPLKTATVA